MKILRVFPERTSFTPIDDLVAIGKPGLFRPDVGEVHISCLFTWQIEQCRSLLDDWSVYDYESVWLGGPAFGCVDDEFIPGRYVKQSIIFTSRGCNFDCPWCMVPEKEGKFRELPMIHPGNIIQDNNLLLANRDHLQKVFLMLKTQSGIEFKGGLDVRLLKDWHIEELRGLKIKELWLAFDEPQRYLHLGGAIRKLKMAGFRRNQIRCYVLAGFDEPILEVEDRLILAWELGALPFVQVYRGSDELVKRSLSQIERKFIRQWSRPAAIKASMEGRR